MLRPWEHLFEVTGPTGAQLIGLLFVVVTLGEGFSATRSEAAIRGFVTPTLVNFSNVLLQAIVVLTPWPSDGPAGVALTLLGLAGGAYALAAIGLKRQADIIELSWLNWLIYNGVPVVANALLIAAGAGLILGHPLAAFALAASTSLLLAVGIYGAWDVTLWVLKNRKR